MDRRERAVTAVHGDREVRDGNPGDADWDVIVVGAGFTGLAAAHELGRAGLRCLVLEADDHAGGLAGTFTVGDRRLERFYHHWFASDTDIFRLCADLGRADLVQRHHGRTGFYYAGGIHRLSTPLDVLRFAPLPPADRLRLGRSVLRAGRVRHWRELEALTAEEWLVGLGGRRVYDRVWRPLLEGKFGPYAPEVGATWMWTKLHLRGGSRSRSGREVLHYLRGGCGALLDAWLPRLAGLGVRIRTGSPVTEVLTGPEGVRGVRCGGEVTRAPRVLVTCAPGPAAALLDRSAHPAAPALRRRLTAIPYLANLCLVLENDRPLSDTYWLNVSDPHFPYVGVIEHTNLDAPEHYGGRHLVYLSTYLPADAPLYRMSDPEVYRYSLPHLRRMFPAFRAEWVRAHHVWRARYAQPVITRHYSRTVPGVEHAVPGLYLAGMAQVFPEDRGTNYALRGGQRAGRLIADRIRTAERRTAGAAPAHPTHRTGEDHD
ncbi:NAD(P)/FAD-dependent oxidoreductase [Streptomyces paromomycinus]|uniref:NAD(P)/FAD-dependent oxidoreductase n=1 Tax=Streptomyces paromomycinus TaxID=92743 RepID=UPI001C3FA820|nr:NAD(P)/FAD-dependent oxidoreductase [Streptomyces paromomycinus]